MRKIMMWVLAFTALLTGVAVASGADSGRKAIQVASTSVVVPSVANVTGVTGSVFRSRISLFNPTAFTYPIRATFHDIAGNMSNVNITMAPDRCVCTTISWVTCSQQPARAVCGLKAG